MIDLTPGGLANALVWVAAGVAGAALAQPIADTIESAVKGGN